MAIISCGDHRLDFRLVFVLTSPELVIGHVNGRRVPEYGQQNLNLVWMLRQLSSTLINSKAPTRTFFSLFSFFTSHLLFFTMDTPILVRGAALALHLFAGKSWTEISRILKLHPDIVSRFCKEAVEKADGLPTNWHLPENILSLSCDQVYTLFQQLQPRQPSSDNSQPPGRPSRLIEVLSRLRSYGHEFYRMQNTRT